ncbi:unnamed protein product, partial [Didymodactylos carnosus]
YPFVDNDDDEDPVEFVTDNVAVTDDSSSDEEDEPHDNSDDGNQETPHESAHTALDSSESIIENDEFEDDFDLDNDASNTLTSLVINQNDLFEVLVGVYTSLTHVRQAVKFIRNHGVVDAKSESPLVSTLKKALRAQFKIHFIDKMSPAQKTWMQVSSTMTAAAKKTLFDNLSVLCGVKRSNGTLRLANKKQLTIDEELCHYVKAVQSATDFRQFWLDNELSLPRLAHLVHQYNAVPATSVASESSFSVAGYICRKQRTSLSPKAVQYSMDLNVPGLNGTTF